MPAKLIHAEKPELKVKGERIDGKNYRFSRGYVNFPS